MRDRAIKLPFTCFVFPECLSECFLHSRLLLSSHSLTDQCVNCTLAMNHI